MLTQSLKLCSLKFVDQLVYYKSTGNAIFLKKKGRNEDVLKKRISYIKPQSMYGSTLKYVLTKQQTDMCNKISAVRRYTRDASTVGPASGGAMILFIYLLLLFKFWRPGRDLCLILMILCMGIYKLRLSDCYCMLKGWKLFLCFQPHCLKEVTLINVPAFYTYYWRTSKLTLTNSSRLVQFRLSRLTSSDLILFVWFYLILYYFIPIVSYSVRYHSILSYLSQSYI